MAHRLNNYRGCLSEPFLGMKTLMIIITVSPNENQKPILASIPLLLTIAEDNAIAYGNEKSWRFIFTELRKGILFFNNIHNPKPNNAIMPTVREMYNISRSPNKPIVINGNAAARISEQVAGSEFLSNMIIKLEAV